METKITPMNEEDEHFETYMKEYNEKKKTDNFDPTMLDYIINDETTLRYEYIKSLKNDTIRIEEMAKYIKETCNHHFPDEFYEWIARDVLGLQYKKWEIDEMKRQYRIKRKRELRKLEEENKKNKRFRKNKKKKMKNIEFKNYENGVVLKF